MTEEFNDKLEKKFNELFSTENYRKLFETYHMFGKESAEMLFKEQVGKTFPETTDDELDEFTKEYSKHIFPNARKNYESFDDFFK